MIGKNTLASTIADILKTKQAVLVVEKGKALGIITRHDVIGKSQQGIMSVLILLFLIGVEGVCHLLVLWPL